MVPSRNNTCLILSRIADCTVTLETLFDFCELWEVPVNSYWVVVIRPRFAFEVVFETVAYCVALCCSDQIVAAGCCP